MFCKFCGNKIGIDNDSAFCEYCGGYILEAELPDHRSAICDISEDDSGDAIDEELWLARLSDPEPEKEDDYFDLDLAYYCKFDTYEDWLARPPRKPLQLIANFPESPKPEIDRQQIARLVKNILQDENSDDSDISSDEGILFADPPKQAVISDILGRSYGNYDELKDYLYWLQAEEGEEQEKISYLVKAAASESGIAIDDIPIDSLLKETEKKPFTGEDRRYCSWDFDCAPPNGKGISRLGDIGKAAELLQEIAEEEARDKAALIDEYLDALFWR